VSKNLPVYVLIGASLLWGLSWLPLRYLNQLGFEGISLLLVSQGILALLFSPFGFRFKLIKDNLKPLLVIALTGGSAILCFTYALIYGDVIRVMVLFYLLPVWGVLGGKFFLGEHPDWIRWLGVVLALGGAFLILGGVSIFNSPPSWIDLMALASGLCFAANNLVFRGVQRLPLSTKLVFMFYGCASISAVLLFLGVEALPVSVAPVHWALLVVYTLSWLLCANIGSQWAVTRMEAGKSSIIIIVELVAAVISAMLIAGERLTLIEWFGCILVVLAAFLEARRQEPESGPKPGALDATSAGG
jgi:EamA-like transporter family.